MEELRERKKDMAEHRQYKKKADAALLEAEEHIKHAGKKVVEAYKVSTDFRSEVVKVQCPPTTLASRNASKR